jgi:hypothetical protein
MTMLPRSITEGPRSRRTRSRSVVQRRTQESPIEEVTRFPGPSRTQEGTHDFLFEHTPDHAERLVRALHDAPATLLMFPNRGRPGKKESTRELVLNGRRGSAPLRQAEWMPEM